jgi:hypothetical protein
VRYWAGSRGADATIFEKNSETGNLIEIIYVAGMQDDSMSINTDS